MSDQDDLVLERLREIRALLGEVKEDTAELRLRVERIIRRMADDQEKQP